MNLNLSATNNIDYKLKANGLHWIPMGTFFDIMSDKPLRH